MRLNAVHFTEDHVKPPAVASPGLPRYDALSHTISVPAVQAYDSQSNTHELHSAVTDADAAPRLILSPPPRRPPPQSRRTASNDPLTAIVATHQLPPPQFAPPDPPMSSAPSSHYVQIPLSPGIFTNHSMYYL